MEFLFDYGFPVGCIVLFFTTLLFWHRNRRARYQMARKDEMIFKAVVIALRKSFRNSGPPVEFDDFYRNEYGATVIQIKTSLKNFSIGKNFLAEYNKVLREEVRETLGLTHPIVAELVLEEERTGDIEWR